MYEEFQKKTKKNERQLVRICVSYCPSWCRNGKILRDDLSGDVVALQRALTNLDKKDLHKVDRNRFPADELYRVSYV